MNESWLLGFTKETTKAKDAFDPGLRAPSDHSIVEEGLPGAYDLNDTAVCRWRHAAPGLRCPDEFMLTCVRGCAENFIEESGQALHAFTAAW